MDLSSRFIRMAQWMLPMPFTIAVILTVVTMLLALVLTVPSEALAVPHWLQIGLFWEQGFWDLLTFAMQMMLMLVLGHVLAWTTPFQKSIALITRYCTTTARAAAIVTACTMMVGLFNWGLGLIFGAILARQTAECARQHGHALHYPIVGAAGYVGLMVWHGGLSGSAPLKVAEANHFLHAQMGQIALSDTVFSQMNLMVTLALLVILPVVMYIVGGRLAPTPLTWLEEKTDALEETSPSTLTGAQHLDHSRILAWAFGGGILGLGFYKGFMQPQQASFSFLTPNFINFGLFGLGLVLHGNFHRYVSAVEKAIVGASGIMIQFPLYAGIAGIIKYSLLIDVLSSGIVAISNEVTFPIFTMISAGVVNVFVPSGGGQWAVQGPIIVEAAQTMGLSYGKCVMAMAYGDQLTNMIQPFWALPLLGITRLQAQDILPYTVLLMLVGGAVYTTGLLLF